MSQSRNKRSITTHNSEERFTDKRIEDRQLRNRLKSDPFGKKFQGFVSVIFTRRYGDPV